MMFVCRPNRDRIPLDLGPVTVRDDASECALADTDYRIDGNTVRRCADGGATAVGARGDRDDGADDFQFEAAEIHLAHPVGAIPVFGDIDLRYKDFIARENDHQQKP